MRIPRRKVGEALGIPSAMGGIGRTSIGRR